MQDILDGISSVQAVGANTVLAFNEAHRLLDRERKQRMHRVVVVASNGQYQCKENKYMSNFLFNLYFIVNK